MKIKDAAFKALEIQPLEEPATGYSVNFDDVIRMQFLEQSARYLGVYVENNPDSMLDKRSIN